MSDNIHGMSTRSKTNEPHSPHSAHSDISLDDELDEYGNINGLIDYECEEDFDQKEFDKQPNK